MPKSKEPELATVGVKLNFTPTEIKIIEEARDLDDERKTGTWIRKAALRAARQVTAERDGVTTAKAKR